MTETTPTPTTPPSSKPTLELSTRLCNIGIAINGRTQKHGDRRVPAQDIPLVGLMLEAAELCALLGDENAHASLFRKNDAGTFEPIFSKHFKPMKLVDRFEDATVIVYFNGPPTRDSDADVNGDYTIELAGVTLANLELEPQVGGLTALEIQVQATPSPKEAGTFHGSMGAQVHAFVTFGKRAEKSSKKQQALPLGNDAGTETEPSDDEKPCGWITRDEGSGVELACNALASTIVGGMPVCSDHAQVAMLAQSHAIEFADAAHLEINFGEQLEPTTPAPAYGTCVYAPDAPNAESCGAPATHLLDGVPFCDAHASRPMRHDEGLPAGVPPIVTP